MVVKNPNVAVTKETIPYRLFVEVKPPVVPSTVYVETSFDPEFTT